MPGDRRHPGYLRPASSIHTSTFFPPTSSVPIESLAAKRGSHELKEFVMTPKFLREEAARFRGMADTADREASKLRYFKMATDFEALAQAADELIAPIQDEAINVNPGKRSAEEPKAGV